MSVMRAAGRRWPAALCEMESVPRHTYAFWVVTSSLHHDQCIYYAYRVWLMQFLLVFIGNCSEICFKLLVTSSFIVGMVSAVQYSK